MRCRPWFGSLPPSLSQPLSWSNLELLLVLSPFCMSRMLTGMKVFLDVTALRVLRVGRSLPLILVRRFFFFFQTSQVTPANS